MEVLLDLVFDGIEVCIEEVIEYIGDKIRAAKMKKGCPKNQRGKV